MYCNHLILHLRNLDNVQWTFQWQLYNEVIEITVPMNRILSNPVWHHRMPLPFADNAQSPRVRQNQCENSVIGNKIRALQAMTNADG